jgi:hypothetical protein
MNIRRSNRRRAIMRRPKVKTMTQIEYELKLKEIVGLARHTDITKERIRQVMEMELMNLPDDDDFKSQLDARCEAHLTSEMEKTAHLPAGQRPCRDGRVR